MTETQPTAGPLSADLPDEGEETGGPLRYRNFRLLWLNNIGYFIVVNAQRFVFGWLVLDGLSRGERDQGLAVFALGIPAMFLVLPAGAWADRLDRRQLLIGSQLGAFVVMLGTGVLISATDVGFGAVVVAAVLAGATAAVGQPVRASLIPVLVPKAKLFSAIAVNALAMTVSMVTGPVLVKLVGDQFGFEGAFFFLALLLGVGLIFVLQLDVPAHEVASEQRAVLAQTADAVRHVWNDRHLRTLFMLLTVAGLTINPAVMVTLQAFVKEELGRNSGDAAPLFALMGLGIAISSIVVMRKGDMANKGTLFQRAMIVGSLMTILMGRTTAYQQLLPLVFVMGLAGGFFINMNQGLIQSTTPQAIMGRVMGLFVLVQAGITPIGALILGLIASVIGVGNTISAAATVTLATVVLTYVRNAELRRLG